MILDFDGVMETLRDDDAIDKCHNFDGVSAGMNYFCGCNYYVFILHILDVTKKFVFQLLRRFIVLPFVGVEQNDEVGHWYYFRLRYPNEKCWRCQIF